MNASTGIVSGLKSLKDQALKMNPKIATQNFLSFEPQILWTRGYRHPVLLETYRSQKKRSTVTFVNVYVQVNLRLFYCSKEFWLRDLCMLGGHVLALK